MEGGIAMGLMDKVKQQANTLAQKAQETASGAQAKFDASQLARRSDPMLKSLGLAVLAERTGRAAPDNAAQIDQLIASLTQHEAQNNVDLVAQAQQAQMQGAAMGGGQYMSSSQAPYDPNLQATMPGAPAGAAPGFPQVAPTTSFPGSAPTSFPQADPTSFPGAAPAAAFPEAAPPTAFPGAAPTTGFPEAAPPTAFPGAAPATGFPEAAPATAFPVAGPGLTEPVPAEEAADQPQTGFPPAGGPTAFPPASGG